MNTLVITHILVGYGIFASWIHALRTIVICGYFITIALSGFYLKPFIPIYASILASSVYACMFFYAALFVKVEIGAYETFYELNVSYNHIATMVPAYIMFGLIISYLTKRFKSILYQSVVSEVKAREEEVKNKNIEEMTRQKTDLFINIAHELKTPVTLISNYLEKYIKTTALSKDLHIIRKNVDKLRVDVGNFLDLEKLEQGQIFYNHDKIIDLSNIINEKVVLFKQAALQKNICMSKKNEAGIIIKADPVAIDRILNNLIDNAIRYTDAGGAIHIKLLPGKRSVFIIIRDNGIGISMEQQKHIFSPYFQASRSKANYQGIGMGLYITKKIIDSLKGKITLESEIAKGSVFTVQLKRYVLKEDEKIEREVPMSGFKFHYNDFDLSDKQVIIGRKNILIVEDNRELLSFLKTNLCNKYNIFLALNGKQALEKMEQVTRPDIIISDIMMDEMDGYELYTHILKDERYKDIPFLFLTAKTSVSEKIKGLSMGALDYICKPFRMEELEIKIVSILSYSEGLKKTTMNEMRKNITLFFGKQDRVGSEEEIFEASCEKYCITKREKEVISKIMEGLENKEIGVALNIAFNTVKNHIKSIFNKCEIQNRVELVNLMRGKER